TVEAAKRYTIPVRNAFHAPSWCAGCRRWRTTDASHCPTEDAERSPVATNNLKNNLMEHAMIRIAIIVGSTRPGRKADAVANWVHEIAKKRDDAEFEVVDIQDFNLPLLDEPVPPSMGQDSKPNTKAWEAETDTFEAVYF